jgi:uncharacterized cupredoxin-like copper-binding protein
VIKPGKSATLTIVFAKAGTYEYLCTVAGTRRRRREASAQGHLTLQQRVRAVGSTSRVNPS